MRICDHFLQTLRGSILSVHGPYTTPFWASSWILTEKRIRIRFIIGSWIRNPPQQGNMPNTESTILYETLTGIKPLLFHHWSIILNLWLNLRKILTLLSQMVFAFTERNPLGALLIRGTPKRFKGRSRSIYTFFIKDHSIVPLRGLYQNIFVLWHFFNKQLRHNPRCRRVLLILNFEIMHKPTAATDSSPWLFSEYCIFLAWAYFVAISVADPDPNPDRMFLVLLDPDPDPLVRGMDPDPDPSIIKQN